MFLSKEFTFDAAHFLTKYHGKCERLHGHTYRLLVTMEGEVKKNGLILDFVILKKIVKEVVIEELDHRCLNDIVENPSAEHMVKWIWKKLADHPSFRKKARLYELTLWETPDSFVTYRGD